MQCTLPFAGFTDPGPIGGSAPSPGSEPSNRAAARRKKGASAPAKEGGKEAKVTAQKSKDSSAKAEKAAKASALIDAMKPATAVILVEEAAQVALVQPVDQVSVSSIYVAEAQAALGTESGSVSVTESGSVSVTESGSGSGSESVTGSVSDSVSLSAPLPPLSGALALDGLRVIVFDVETTGTDRRNDQVIELGVQLGLGDVVEHKTWRFRPDVPIHPGAQAVHGISMADLEGCPSFRECIDEIAALFERAEVIIGYNIAFDIDMLQSEYERAGKRPLDFSGKTIVDAFRLWQQCEPRSLQHAHQRFVGDRFTAAHSASADVAATGRVLTGMLRAFGLEQQDWGSIAGLCDPQRATWIGPTRHLRWESGVVILGFGKHAGSPLHKIAHGPDRSFLRWVMEKDFPQHVIEICRAALEAVARVPADACDAAAEPVAAWVRERFGNPPAPAVAPAPVAHS